MILAQEIEKLHEAHEVIMTRVKNRIAELSQQATDTCLADLEDAQKGPFAEAEKEIEALKASIASAKQLEQRVMQLEGLYQITQELRRSVAKIEAQSRAKGLV
ncbi:hypothetical protein B9G98_00870 [Wickerhamiella sorbophila]|uniref:Uncharacterized protein n=1 Tax=Wickerhamiella sorbophila TaxID=45607 RepID=A0A2T0FE55_9ASCO|nr:hypothetical protein B9G98_00870 [Wickerhamiella sorbophila]PRT53250.1 hypothetical protein B9G98_00870 [Wickerhamiella sorbophila]